MLLLKFQQKLQYKSTHIICIQSCLLVRETIRSGKWAPSTRWNILQKHFMTITEAEFSLEMLVAVYRTSRCHTGDASIMYPHLHINLRLYIVYVTIHNSYLRSVQFLEAKCEKA